MKLTKFANLMGLGLILAVTALGCKTTPPGVTHIPGGGGPRGNGRETPPPPYDPNKGPVGETADFGHPLNSADLHKGWIENATIFKAYTAHFDFDSTAIKPADKPNLAAVANELTSNPAWAVRVEGFCDERGTEEYNRSLGERRALALREALIALGIDPTRVDTISYGEGRPVATGHDETAWKQNRRGEFIQLTPPK